MWYGLGYDCFLKYYLRPGWDVRLLPEILSKGLGHWYLIGDVIITKTAGFIGKTSTNAAYDDTINVRGFCTYTIMYLLTEW